MKAVIDRFEGKYAVVLFDDEEIAVDMPRVLLPSGAKEGDILSVQWEIDRDATKAKKQQIVSLLDKLKAKGRE